MNGMRPPEHETEFVLEILDKFGELLTEIVIPFSVLYGLDAPEAHEPIAICSRVRKWSAPIVWKV